MSLGDGVTWGDWVRLVAAEHGHAGLTDDAVEVLLWERTAWPMTTELGVLRPQVIAALIGPELCPCCGGPVGTGADLDVCAGCLDRMGWR